MRTVLPLPAPPPGSARIAGGMPEETCSRPGCPPPARLCESAWRCAWRLMALRVSLAPSCASARVWSWKPAAGSGAASSAARPFSAAEPPAPATIILVACDDLVSRGHYSLRTGRTHTHVPFSGKLVLV